jgi:hypothetical protein
MKGIFSGAPAPYSVRLLVGGYLLLLLATGIVLLAGTTPDPANARHAGVLVALALLCLFGAALGEPGRPRRDSRGRARHHD